jgi:hypothetical protein
MLRNLIAKRSAGRLSRRAAVSRLAGAGAALAVTASGLDRSVAAGAASSSVTPPRKERSGPAPLRTPLR